MFHNSSRPESDFLPKRYFAEGTDFPEKELETCESVREINRCFFLHLGRALGIHPFAMCCAYRHIARKMMLTAEDGDLSQELLQSVLERNQWVDSISLASIWPVELDQYQILIVNLDANSQFNSERSEQQGYGFTLIRPPSSPLIDADGNWAGKEIILTLQFGHFTYLEPDCEILTEQPIKTLLDWGRKIKVNIATPMDIFPDPTESGRERCSIRSSLDELLAAGSSP
jgi:hypothetical protein